MSTLTTLSSNLAEKFGMGNSNDVLDTLKNTAFKGEVTDSQMVALLVVANQYGLNPWTKEIYAFPDKKNGIVPVVGVDGWSRIINENPHLDGIEFRQSETVLTMPDAKPCPEWIECVMYRKDRSHPTVVREYLDEVYRPPTTNKQTGYTNFGPWQSHTKRFLRHKSLIQCARLAFGFVGIYDEDEAQRIKESSSGGEIIEAVVKEKPEYSAEAFNKNKDSWKKLIDEGRKTPEEIINAVETKATMTEPQKTVVLNMKKEAINENS